MDSSENDQTPVRIEVTVPRYLSREVALALQQISTGHAPRLRTIECDRAQIKFRAMKALDKIVSNIEVHEGTGTTRRLVRFLAAIYNGGDFSFDLIDLRALGDELASACLDYLDYDRLGIKEVHHHLPGGEKQLHRWMRSYGLLDHD